nr:MAG TPA: hypothetical protein [Caudoviricetes sp.]
MGARKTPPFPPERLRPRDGILARYESEPL